MSTCDLVCLAHGIKGDHGVSKTIGTQIENSPWTWTEFVMRQETLSDPLPVEQTAH